MRSVPRVCVGWKFFLELLRGHGYGLSFLFLLVLLQELHRLEAANGDVVENGEFAIVRTHESGTYVGIKQYIDSGEVKSDDIDIDESNVAASASDTFEGATPELESRRIYYAFKGIPYAAKPLGSLRWKEPEPFDVKDSGPKDSTKYGQVCSQWNSVAGEVTGSQDCLYLNIFTPRLFFSSLKPSHSAQVNYSKFDDDPRETKRHLPVLLYIHDGDFVSGSGNLPLTAEQAFMKQDIILVTFNYRLGVFGYLSSGTPRLPGNYGLLDQISVLKWLHKNVHRFGGNSNRITIFGNTLFLQVSPVATGLFHNVILMHSTSTLAALASGSSLINREPKEYFVKFANAAGCPVSEELLSPDDADGDFDLVEDLLNDCLRQKPVVDLIQIQQNFYKFWKLPRLLTPTIDEGLSEVGDVLPNLALQALPALGIPKKSESESGSESEPPPMMMGVTAYGEGFDIFYEFYKSFNTEETFVEDANRRPSTRKVLRSKLRRYLEHIIGAELTNNAKTFNGIWNYYFGAVQFNSDITDNPIDESLAVPQLFWSQLLQLFGDVTVYVPYWTLLVNLIRTDSLKLFNYVFAPKIQFSQLLEYRQYRDRESESYWENGVPTQEEFYLFHQPKSQSDESMMGSRFWNGELSDIMVNIWVSFAAYENPKNAVKKYKKWTRWTKFGENYNRLNQTMYYEIKEDVSQMRDKFKKQEAQFWLETVPQLYSMSSTVEELEDWPTLFWIFISLTCILFLIVVSIIGYMFWSKYSEKY